MRILKEFFRHDGLNTSGKILHRKAIRGIIFQENSLLMIYSPHNGDYKFPGGGVDDGESYQETLVREIREESGAQVARILGEFGAVIEYSRPHEPEYDLFKMTSRYYFCEIEDGFQEQRLDHYEKELGFRPMWVTVEEATRTNTILLESSLVTIPRWTDRETFVLKQLREQLSVRGNS
jgi:8-oxo-dGTP pyrophosphatase MutT (NUDIX family)